jgi:hypothetical protein
MATTTPNFGWPVPTSTDLVKDGATAIEALGDAIDASLVDLEGGTTGQILAKASNTDMDFAWITNDVGDITEVTAGTGISGGGTSGAVTVTNSMATTIDAKGDLIIGTADNTFDRLAVGANNTILTADSTAATGQKWSNAANLNQLTINSARTTEKLVVSYGGGGTDGFYFNNEEASATSRIYINFYRATGAVGNISGTNTAIAYNTTSDYRLKENVNKIEGAIDKVNLLHPVHFNFIVDKDNPVDGFIAHEVETIVPNAVSGKKDAIDEDGNPLYQGVDYSKLVPILTAAIQELSAKVAALEAAK